MWELPMYESLLRSIAGANADLPMAQRVRVVGGAVPIDWPRVCTPEALVPWLDADRHLAEIARRALRLGRRPALIPVAGTPLAALPTGRMLFEGHHLADRTLGEVVDALVYHGAGEDVVRDPDEGALDPAFTAELARRAGLRAALAGAE